MVEIVLAIFLSIAATEIWAWLPEFSNWLLKYHVSKLPQDLRERLLEEWQAVLHDTPGNLSKFVVAVDLFRGVRKIRHERSMENLKSESIEVVVANAPQIREAGFEPGKIIRVKAGPFAGFEGTVIRREGKNRVLLSIKFLEQCVSMEMNEGLLEVIA